MRRSPLALGALLVGAALARGPEGLVLGEPGMRHAGDVLAVAFSPDGTLLASSAITSHVRLWHVPGGAPAGDFAVEADWVHDVAWSPGGDALALACSDATVRVLDPTTGAELYRDRSHQGEVHRVLFLPDGRVASGGRTGVVFLHDLAGGGVTELRAPELPAEETGDGPRWDRMVSDLAATRDGAHLAVVLATGTMHVWDLAGPTRVRTLEHVAPGRVARRPDTDQLLVLRVPERDGGALGQASLELLPLPTLAPPVRLRAEGEWSAATVAWAPDGSALLLGEPGAVRELPVAGGPGRRHALGDLPVVRVAVSPSGAWVAAAIGPEVRLLDRATGTVMVAGEGHRRALGGLGSDAAGRLHSIGAFTEYKVWDLREGLLLQRGEPVSPMPTILRGGVYDEPVRLVRGTPTREGDWLVFSRQAGGDLELREGDGPLGKGQWFLPQGTTVAAAARADLAVAGTEDGAVHLLRPSRPATGTRPVEGGHDGRVTALAVSADGAMALSGGRDARVRRVDVRGRRSVALPGGHVGPVVDLELSADGRVGASGGLDRTVFLWDVPGGQATAILGTESLDLTGWVALSGAADVLAAGTTEGGVRLFAVPSGKPLGDLPCGVGPVGPLHFVGDQLVAATQDGTLRRWPASRWGELLRAAPAPVPAR